MPPTNPAPARTPAFVARGVVQSQGVECDVKRLEVGDVLMQAHRRANGGSVAALRRVTVAPQWVGGVYPYRLTLTCLATGEEQVVTWGGTGRVTLVAGPKVEALARHPDLARAPHAGALPVWRGTASV